VQQKKRPKTQRGIREVVTQLVMGLKRLETRLGLQLGMHDQAVACHCQTELTGNRNVTCLILGSLGLYRPICDVDHNCSKGKFNEWVKLQELRDCSVYSFTSCV
jgi:hypothetical protein